MTDFRANVVVKLLDRVTRPARQVGAALKRLGRIEAVKRLALAFRNVGTSLGGVVRQASRLGRTALFGGGLFGGGLVLGLKQTAAQGDRIAKTADRLRIGIATLQEFRFAADRSGIAVDAFDSSLERFVKRVGEASRGTGEAGKVLRFLGVEFRDSNGQMRDTEDLLAEVLDKLGGLDDAATQAAAAAAIFGREGLAMVNLAAEGADGIAALRAEARRFGVLSEETARKSERFVDQMTNLGAAVNGLKFAVAGELLPAVTGLIRQLTEWIAANRALVAPKIIEFVKQFGQVMLDLSAIAAGILAVLRPIAQFFGSWTPIIGGIAALMAGPLVLAIGKVAFALGSILLPVLGAIVAALLANPIGLVVTALAVGAHLLINNWEEVSAFFEKLWADLSLGVRIFLLVTELLWKSIKKSVNEFVTDVLAALKAFNPVTLIRRAVDEVVNYLSTIDLAKIGTDFIMSFWNGVKSVALPESLARFLGLGDLVAGPSVSVPALGPPIPVGAAAADTGGGGAGSGARLPRGPQRVLIEGRNLPPGAQFEISTESPDLEIDAGLSLEFMP